MNFLEAIFNGRSDNLRPPRDFAAAEGGLFLLGCALADQRIAPDPSTFPIGRVNPSAGKPRPVLHTVKGKAEAPKPAPVFIAPEKRKLHDMLADAVRNTPKAPKEPDDETR